MVSDMIKHLLLPGRNNAIPLYPVQPNSPCPPQKCNTIMGLAPQLCFLKEEEKNQECECGEFLLVERQQKQDCTVCVFRLII